MLTTASALLLVGSLAAAPQQGSAPVTPPGQPPVQAPAGKGEEPIELPVSISKIKKAIARPPAFKPRGNVPVFRVEIFAKKPTIDDILGADYLKGPVPYGGMRHDEFLAMVTPVEHRGFSAFSNREGMAIAATSVGLHWALLKAYDQLKKAHTALAKRAARREVMEALNELEKARARAGLPPK